MRILVVSDLHGQPKTLLYLQEIIKKEKPEAIIISGDITNRDDLSFLEELFNIFATAKLPAYIIWGNADDANAQKMIEQSKYSIHLMPRQIGKFNIYGISETDEPVMPNSNDIAGSILVTHRPPLSAVLNAKYLNAPKFHISGHIHKRANLKKYPSTIHIQVPTLQDKRYAIFTPELGSIRFFSI